MQHVYIAGLACCAVTSSGDPEHLPQQDPLWTNGYYGATIGLIYEQDISLMDIDPVDGTLNRPDDLGYSKHGCGTSFGTKNAKVPRLIKSIAKRGSIIRSYPDVMSVRSSGK